MSTLLSLADVARKLSYVNLTEWTNPENIWLNGVLLPGALSTLMHLASKQIRKQLHRTRSQTDREKVFLLQSFKGQIDSCIAEIMAKNRRCSAILPTRYGFTQCLPTRYEFAQCSHEMSKKYFLNAARTTQHMLCNGCTRENYNAREYNEFVVWCVREMFRGISPLPNATRVDTWATDIQTLEEEKSKIGDSLFCMMSEQKKCKPFMRNWMGFTDAINLHQQRMREIETRLVMIGAEQKRILELRDNALKLRDFFSVYPGLVPLIGSIIAKFISYHDS